jgi:Cu/Ag efflux protein CusF
MQKGSIMNVQRKRVLSCAVALAVGAASGAVMAQDHKDTAAGGAMKVSAAKVSDMTNGEIRKLDKDAKKITIKHEAIKSLDMPAMTMVFLVNDAAILGALQVGDKIRFKAETIKGVLTVTDIQAAK